jgi:hypothetical protein
MIASFVMAERDVNVNAGERTATMRVGSWSVDYVTTVGRLLLIGIASCPLQRRE